MKQRKNNIKCLNGGNLKTIALFCMTIDHFAVAVVLRLIPKLTEYPILHTGVSWAYDLLRAIGRPAFPIFCFFIVEGFFHTRNRMKYAIRLFFIGIVSEIPFDMVLFHSFADIRSQNVFFTLLIGLLAIWNMEEAQKRFSSKKWLQYMFTILSGVLGFVAAAGINTDYGCIGVAAIVSIYLIEKNRPRMMIVLNAVAFMMNAIALFLFDDPDIITLVTSVLVIFLELVLLRDFKKQGYKNEKKIIASILPLCAGSLGEVCAVIDVPLVARYNNERGRQIKWLFYMYYPCHLLILALLAMLLKVY